MGTDIGRRLATVGANTATGAATGSMLGPVGTAVGAFGGLALGIGKWAYDHWWAKKQQEREDNGVQRWYADARAAGLSPAWLAAGQAGSSVRSEAPDLSDIPQRGVNNIMQSIGLDIASRQLTMEENRNQAEISQINANTDYIKQHTQNLVESQRGQNIENNQREERLKTELEKIRAEIANTRMGTAESRSRIKLNNAQEKIAEDQRRLINRQIEHIEEQIKLDGQRGRIMAVEKSREELKLLNEMNEAWATMSSGNMTRSFIGRLATDILQAASVGQRNEALRKIQEQMTSTLAELARRD